MLPGYLWATRACHSLAPRPSVAPYCPRSLATPLNSMLLRPPSLPLHHCFLLAPFDNSLNLALHFPTSQLLHMPVQVHPLVMPLPTSHPSPLNQVVPSSGSPSLDPLINTTAPSAGCQELWACVSIATASRVTQTMSSVTSRM